MTINTKEARALVERLVKGARRLDRKPADNNAAEADLRKEAAAALTAALDEVERLREAATQAFVAINQAEYEVAFQALKEAMKGTD